MENKKFDNHVQNLFKNKEVLPSDSSWERLHTALVVQEKSTWKKFRPYMYAASILLLIPFLGYFQFEASPVEPNVVDTFVVEQTIDSTKKTQQLNEEFFVEAGVASVEKEPLEQSPQKVVKKSRKQPPLLLASEQQQLAKKQHVAEKSVLPVIAVRAEDLLLSVVLENQTTSFVSVKNQEKPSVNQTGLTIDPKAILAAIATEEVLYPTGNRFLKKVKKEVNSLAFAINNRNN